MSTITNPLPPYTDDMLAELEADIRSRGIRIEALISDGPYLPGAMIDGFHRQKIADKIGIPLPTKRIPIHDEYEFELEQIKNNYMRRHLTQPQRIKLAMRQAELEEYRARERKFAGAPAPAGQPKGRSTEIAAEKLGIKRNQIEAAKKIYKFGDPQIIAEFEAGTLRPNAAVRKIKRATGQSPESVLAGTVANKLGELPTGTKFGAIIVMPLMRTKLFKAEPGRMMPNEMGALALHKIMTKNAIVAMQFTTRWLEDGFKAMRSLGLIHVATVTWVLDDGTQGEEGKYPLNERCRFFLLGTNGKVPESTKTTDVILGGRGTVVPRGLIDLLDEWVTDPGLVMFSEVKKPGWESWMPVSRGVTE